MLELPTPGISTLRRAHEGTAPARESVQTYAATVTGGTLQEALRSVPALMAAEFHALTIRSVSDEGYAPPGSVTLHVIWQSAEMGDPDGNGTVTLQNDAVIVEGPAAGGRPATIGPGPGVAITVNGIGVTEPVPVTPDDLVLVQVAPARREEHAVEVALTDDLMGASVAVFPTSRSILKECGSARELVIQPGWVPTVPLRALCQSLAAAGVLNGIDEPRLAAAWEQRDGRHWTIAQGKLPQPGRDGWIEWRSPRSADLWAVEVGEVLGVVHPATPGIPGYTVTGKVLPAPGGADEVLLTGAGTARRGAEVVATMAGRCILTRTGDGLRISVSPLRIHEGDLGPGENLDAAEGDLLVLGNVHAEASVTAALDVFIRGDVTRAHVAAGGSLEVSGLVSDSLVIAGGREAERLQLGPVLRPLAHTLHALEGIMDQIGLTEPAAPSQFGAVAALMAATRFPDLPSQAEALREFLRSCHLDFDLERSLTVVVGAVSPGGLRQLTALADLQRILSLVDQALKGIELQQASGRRSQVKALGLVSSVCTATGDVQIGTGGAAGGTILTGGDLVAPEVAGTVITCASAHVGHVKAAASCTRFVTPEAGVVYAAAAEEGTEFMVGRYVLGLPASERLLRVYLHPDRTVRTR